MDTKKLLYFFLSFFLLGGFLLKDKKTEVEKLRDKHAKFLKNHKFQSTMKLGKAERKSIGLPPNAYFEQKYLSEINPGDGLVHKENVFKIQKELSILRKMRSIPGEDTNPWVERGPNNVGGRSRAVIFDPNDPTNETVFAGGVSGGLWKNNKISDFYSKWERVGIPENLSVSCIVIDPNNPKIFYVGTGESYVEGEVNGDGVWKSLDGGNSWTQIFGGKAGESYYDQGTKFTVNSPASLKGEYTAILARDFGGNLSKTITGDLVLVNDGSSPNDDACENIQNSPDLDGKIAVIKRGSCNFDDKVLRAENAGAIAVIMVNNVLGAPIPMGGDDPRITIPSVMISLEDGNKLIGQLSSTVSVTLEDLGGIDATLVPGIYHINDIVVRNVSGKSEVYVAVGESGYFSSSPGAVIGGDLFGLYKSTNGVNFTQVTLPKTSKGKKYEPNKIEIAADNSIYLTTNRSQAYGDGGGKVFHSTDGTNFLLKYSVPNGMRTEITMSSSNEKVGYLLAETNKDPVKIYKTTDGFSTVTETTLPNDEDRGIPSNDFTRGQAFYNLIIKVDPNNDNIVYTGGIDLFKSSDGGTTWNQLTHWYGAHGLPYMHADQHEIVFASSEKMIFTNDGGIYYSNNSGATIEPRNNNFNTLQFYTIGVAPTSAFNGSEFFLAGSQDNGTQLIQNASKGINSSIMVYGGDGAASFFDTDGNDRYYIATYIYNSSINLYDYNTGKNKLINSEDTSFGDFINQADLDSNLDILYTNYSEAGKNQIRRYSNLKENIQKTLLTNYLMNAAPSAIKVSPYTLNSSKLYLGLKNGRVLIVRNADTSSQWINITGSNFIGSVSDIEFGANENEIFVTMHNYGVQNIWYSNDGGSSWSGKEGNLPDIPVKTILQNPLNREEVIVGTEIGVWKTSNFSSASPSWTQSYNGMSNVPVLDLDLRDDNTVFAATYGRGIFSGKFSGETASTDNVAYELKELTIYPTISNGKFTIRGNQELGDSEINIYNVKGQQVYTDRFNFTSKKSNEIEVNLSSGIYFVNVIDSKLRKTSKKIIIE